MGKIEKRDLTLVEILRDQAVAQPNQIAFKFLPNGEQESDQLTYQELDQKARAIAYQLGQKINRGERVLLLYPPGLEFISAFFGCLYADAIAVPVNPPRPNRPATRLLTIKSDSQATLALTTTSLFSKLKSQLTHYPELATLPLIVSDEISIDLASNWEKSTTTIDSLAFLQYTSGSTGTPKGVMVTHGNLLHNSQYIKQAFQLTQDSISVSWLPSFHDMGLIDGIIQPLYTGFMGVLMKPESFIQHPWRWLQAITNYKATHCGGPNFAYDLCVQKITNEQLETFDLSSWESAYSGSEPVRRETLERFIAKFAPCGFPAKSFYPCYGMAESTLMISGGLVQEEPIYCTVAADALEQNGVTEASKDVENVRHLVGCGRGWLDTKIVIVEPESFQQCHSGQVGEIWVSGESVAQGYWNQPELSEQAFGAYLADPHHGPFLRTGDLGFLREGELFITGRMKDMIIIRGRNYYPQDIEITVETSHPALRGNCCAAFAIEKDNTEQLVIVAEVERTHLRHLNVKEVVAEIGEAIMQQHEIQAYGTVLIKTGSIPKTSSGKIQRRICKEKFLCETLNIVGGKIGKSEL
ncbi:Putative fatty-acid--CoA ligase fadD21 [Planktothrix tepida]|uniref:Acetyl-CoA synthetase-like n=1 Tax=Planktothrix tepida PCC 9214 TaxID=671072 RepID=A0A1J1LP93_9CYAN|nr:fatty acyl-AMP ligase [Planktothrix tepida]CAD5954489.1 Putative fatty-acid--CoA ligase fadD21 [Planktothrix tepida]CUR34231.1 acetyl-CoA synthetase-like [Planktothrix tepida PCC 9214]